TCAANGPQPSVKAARPTIALLPSAHSLGVWTDGQTASAVCSRTESATRGLKLRSVCAWRPSIHNRHGSSSKARRLSAHKSLAVGKDDDTARRRIYQEWIIRPGKTIW